MTDLSQLEPRRVGQFTRHKACRFCRKETLVTFLDFGQVPLAGAFLRREQVADEIFYPLTLCFCTSCGLVQVNNAVSAETLFGEYFYFSSAIQTLVAHFEDFAREVAERFLQGQGSRVAEIGCNDGVLLKPLAARGIRSIGIDPARNVVQSIGAVENLTVLTDFFGERVAQKIVEEQGQADAILSSYSFAHIDDMWDVMKGIQILLKPDGVFIFEVYYLPTLLGELQYDMMYHEHFSYYSLACLARFFDLFGMEVFEVKKIPGVRAGTIRFYVRNRGHRKEPVSPSVGELLEEEKKLGLDDLQTYLDFGRKVALAKEELLRLLSDLKRQGKRIIGYGASGRGTMIMNFCGIDDRFLDYVVDDAPAKHGFLTPGTHLKILPWDATERPPKPDYALVFAWSFIDEVLKRRQGYLQAGGKFIVPLPQVRIIP